MINVRIAILSVTDDVLAFMDNTASNTLHYYNDVLHNYLEGTTNTFEFTTDTTHPDNEHLVVGNHLSFRYGSRDYYMNIVSVNRTEYTVEVTAYALVFELLNEQTGEYKAIKAMTFSEYLTAFNFASNVLTIGNNEVSEKKITHEWTGDETILSRMYSLATAFDAELEFIPQLRNDYTLDKIVLNIYKEHSDSVQGVGSDRTDEVLRYGVNISGITKKSDITELITAIRPFGKDNLTVTSLDKREYDSDGNLEYLSSKGSRNILAVQAVEKFPSNSLANVSDRYTVKQWSYDTDNVNTLYGQALAYLKKLCVPQVEYTIDGYVNAEIGDTFTVQDEEFQPTLYLSVRVSEQEISFTTPDQNKTTYSNVQELQSEISDELLKKMNALIEENKAYILNILSHRDTDGNLILNAKITDGVTDVTSKFSESNFTWYKMNGGESETVGTGTSYTVADETAIYRCVYSDEGD